VSRFFSRWLVTVLGSFWASGPVQSAPAPAPDESKPALEEIVVTGSRIPVPANITATSPIQIVTAQDIALAGQTDATNILNSLPQTVINSGIDFGNNSSPANAAGGFATADLRGLGPQRTLVLVDGRRLGIGDPNTNNPNPAPDLDQIPTALIDRVEVVTGGASATYGSDAIAGVVNFIMKKNFEGIQLDGQYGFAQHHQKDYYIQAQEAAVGITPPTGSIRDGYKRDVSVLAGTNFDEGEGNLTGYFIYHNQDAVPGAARDFSACQAVSTNGLTGVPTQAGITCVGSHDSNRFVTNAGAGPGYYSVVGQQFVPYPAAGSVPPPRFNPAPYMYAQRQDTRYQAGLSLHLTVNETVKPYLEFSFMNDRTLMQLAPSGLFLGNNTLTSNGTYFINCSNPLLSAQEAATICTPAQIAADKVNRGSVSADLDIGRRNIEGAGRQSFYEHINYRAVAGATGKLGAAWAYDAYVLYSYTSLFQSNQNYLNYAAINNALQVKTNDSGRPECIVGGSCIPYNIFTTGGVTAQQLSYLYTPGTDSGTNSEQIAHVDMTAQLGRYGISSPWAHDGVALNVGAEHRLETLDFAPDAAELSGALAGYTGALVAIDQAYSVNEGFLEMRVPIAQSQPGIYDLTVDSGYRYSHYSTAGVTNTYKFEVQYAPLPDVRLRYSYDRVIRAPNLIELYTPQAYGGGSVGQDPCAPTNNGKTRATASLTDCEHTHVSAAEYGNGFGPSVRGTSTIVQCPGNCGQVSGGNVDLAPETADTWSFGLSFTPTAFTNFTASLDYFHISLTNEVGIVPANIILNQCLATGNPTYCSQIVRTQQGGLSGATIAGGGYILQTNVNTGAVLVSGIDLQSNYRWPLANGWGTLTASLSGTWTQHNSISPYQGAPSYDCAGLFGSSCLNGSVNPTWRHNLRVNWDTPWKVLLSAQWRFIGHSSFDNNSSQPFLYTQEEGFFDPLITHIPNYSYLDLSTIWRPTRGVEVRAGINNVFDKDPPFLPQEISGAAGGLNTFPTYDVLGREIFLAFRAKFW
jgi:iron complex outermembrane receptor protein